MNARQMGFFTQAEWQKGLTDLQCDSALKLQLKLDYLRNLMNDPNVFKNIYRYAYDFARVSVEKTNFSNETNNDVIHAHKMCPFIYRHLIIHLHDSCSFIKC